MTKIIAPKVSVVMPLYKENPYLSEAIESILNQTFSEFEFIIICDEPSDTTREILDTYILTDQRIKVFYNQKREGLVLSLNKGLMLAKGEYIARMDSDDISHLKRFEKQIIFMDKNPDIGLCGSFIKTIGLYPDIIYKFPLKDEEIKTKNFFGWAIAHPVVLFRKSLLNYIHPWYDPDYKYCEDYEFWSRLKNITKFSTIPEVLLYYRSHDQNICNMHHTDQQQLKKKIRAKMIKEMYVPYTDNDLVLFNKMCEFEPFTYAELNELCKFLNSIIQMNKKLKIYAEKMLQELMHDYWFSACSGNITCGYPLLLLYFSFLSKSFQPKIINEHMIITMKTVYYSLKKTLLFRSLCP